MKLLTLLSLFILLAPAIFSQANEEHQWKAVSLEEGNKTWFDTASLDTAKGEEFEVWVLKLHTPPLKFDGIEEEAYRSKTLYAFNLNSVKYGYVEVKYYSVTNEEIYSYEYKTRNASDDIKYPYPILKDTVVHEIVKEFFKVRGHSHE